MKTPKNSQKSRLVDKIIRRKAAVGVIGLGYVGLPLAVAFAEAGFRVTGFDSDKNKVDSLKKGKNYIPDLPDSLVAALTRQGKLKATDDFSALKKMDAISICVPTPLRKTRDPDISYIVQSTEEIKRRLHPGQLVVLESTTYPGTTQELVLPELEATGLKAGKDFFLAFSPERIDPGNEKFGLQNTPKIIGGITPACTQISALLYRQIASRVISVSSAAAAEMVKLLENTFRAVNIGLVNETLVICNKLGINTWEVIEAAASKPFGFMPFYPGPGLGGHCIPIDPHYLSWKLKMMNYTTRFIELASEVNHQMPSYVFQKILAALNAKQKAVKGARVLLLGVAYKKNVSDTRESPAYDVAQLLAESGGSLDYSDPYVKSWQTDWRTYRSKKITPAMLKKYDCAILLTDHDQWDLKTIVRHSRMLLDTRNATKGMTGNNIILL